MYRVSIISFFMMAVLLVGLNIFGIEKPSVLLQVTGSLFSLSFILPAAYIWLDGFNRFKATIGFYSGKWVAYVVFNVIAGLYLHHAYKKHS
ncbi:hypothetical protein NBRC116493_16150 [Aurantivibrio infirmus]